MPQVAGTQLQRCQVFLASLVMLLSLAGCKSTGRCDLSYAEKTVDPDSIFNFESTYIAVIGDIQEYTENDKLLQYLHKTNVWLKSQQKYFNIFACVLQDGDLTWANNEIQWQRADCSLNSLGDNLLFIPVTGNHDYTWGNDNNPMEVTDRNSTMINQLTNLSALRSQPFLQYEQGKIENIVVPIKVNQDPLNVIALEFGPRKSVVLWADSIVKSDLNRKYILMTHEWLSRSGERIHTDSYAEAHFPNSSYSTPEEIWQTLVYPNDNILCVICGHNGFCKYLFSKNNKGREVCQILFNLQYQENGGNGMVQLWEFPKHENVINISVYNTITRQFHPDPDTSITIPL